MDLNYQAVFRKIYKTPILIAAVCLVAAIIIQLIFGLINDWFLHISNQNPIDNYSFKEKIFLGVILAPFIETFICQYLAFKLIKLITKNPIYIIGLASLFFSVNHYYNWLYMVVMFFIGLILNLNYYAIRRISKYAFGLTFLLHAMMNFIALLSR